MKSAIRKHSLAIRGHKTSVSLEDAFWKGVNEIAKAQNVSLGQLVESLDVKRENKNLSSEIRLHVLGYYRAPKISRC